VNPSATRRHRRSIRLPAFDYRSHGAYFITFCTRERRKLLARIVDDRSELSTIGQIALDDGGAPPNYVRTSLSTNSS
jgi:hypothetical protein